MPFDVPASMDMQLVNNWLIFVPKKMSIYNVALGFGQFEATPPGLSWPLPQVDLL